MSTVTRKFLLLTVTLGAGLVLVGCGDDDTATTPAPAPPPPPPPPPPAPEPEPEPEPEAPATPTGLMVSATTMNSITWTWNAVEGAIGYAVQVSADEMFDETDTIHPSAEATFTASPLPPETSVFVRVAAAGGTLEAPLLSAWTTHVTGMSAMPPPPPPAPEAPGSPTGLMVSGTTETSITWTWNAVDGATGYSVQVSSDEMFDDMDTTHSTEETTYTASDLAPSTSVYVRVAATSDAGMSGYTTHATGMSATPPPPPPAVAPDAPTGLSVSSATDTSITWSWDAVDDADGYQVQFNSAENFDGVDAMNTGETSHTQTGLSGGMTGYLRVRSTSGSGDAMLASAWTAHLTAMTRMRPGAPMNVTATPGDGSITWTWDAADNADSYYIQYSEDGAFTAEGEAMEVMETSYTKSDLGEGATAYLRVRASGGTGDEERLMGGWSSPIRGMSATPTIPPVPTGLNVSAVGTRDDGSRYITWTWNEVMGATGYQFQISYDEDFSDEEAHDNSTTSVTLNFPVDQVAPPVARIRVRAVGEGTVSDWSTHVSSSPPALPPAPEPAPEPVTVTFSLSEDAKSQHFMRADDDDDEASAEAYVNAEIMVESNTTAEITPMWLDDAAAVSVAASAGNMPFTYVDWRLPQSTVLDMEEGATFKVQRTVVGANQTMEPTGDVQYVTCGPFACQDGMVPPEITIENSNVCNAFDPDLMLQVGMIDNDVVEATEDDGTTGNDGMDIGWVTSQDGAMSVTHHFSNVAGGTNYKVAGRDSTKGSDEPLSMDLGGTREATAGAADDTDEKASTHNGQYAPALRVSWDGVEAGTDDTRTAECLTYTARNTRGGLDRPDNCFRIVGDPDYLNGYTVEVAAKGSGVTWGSVNWEDDPFEDLECGSETFTTSDQVDVCEVLFQAEVDQATEEGWETLTWVLAAGATDATDTVLGELQAAVKGGASSRQFTTLWFDHDLDGQIKHTAAKPEPMHDLYDQNDATPDDDTPGNNFVGGAAQANQTHIEISLLDKDNDPAIGDFGKIDILNADAETGEESDFDPDGKADNFGTASTHNYADVRACTEDDGGDDADDTICDASRDWDVTVKFASGTFGCEAERSFTISCTWDASGEVKQSRRDDDQTGAIALDVDGDDANIGDFVKCEVE